MTRTRISLIALTAALLLTSAAPAAADVRYRFLHHNICGNICEQGDHAEPMSGLAEKIVAHQSTVVSLNETCLHQVTSLRSQLANRGYAMEYFFAQTDFGDNTCSEDKFGIAILSRPSMWGREEWSLPDDVASDTRQRKMLCGTINLARNAKLCTTHLHAGSENIDSNHRWFQTQFIAQETDWMVDFWPVIFMGDFNGIPIEPSLNFMYTREHGQDWSGYYGHGEYKEVDRNHDWNAPCRCGELTWPYPSPQKKLDYIFLNNADWHDVQGDVVDPHSLQASDHRIMRGNALLRTG